MTFRLEPVTDKPAAESGHEWIAPREGAAPAQRDSFEQCGATWQRVTDVSDSVVSSALSPNYPYDGFQGRGLTNGYSKYSCEGRICDYVIAFGWQPWISVCCCADHGQVVERLTHKLPDGRVGGIGETNDIRWDLSGDPSTEHDIIYTSWPDGLYRYGVSSKRGQKIRTLPPGYEPHHEGHAGQGANGLRLVRGYCQSPEPGKPTHVLWAVNYRTGKAVDLTPRATVRDIFDVSPSGRWVMLAPAGTSRPVRFFSADEIMNPPLGEGIPLPCGNSGHDGWAYDYQGREVYCFQDNENDWFSAFEPESRTRTDMVNMRELGWSMGQHMTVNANPEAKGWVIMCCYAPGAEPKDWSHNQILGLEIKPHDQGARIWRLGHTNNYFGDKETYYFAEGFGSLSPDAQRLWIGSNWNNTDNLELYRIDLPERWWEQIGNWPVEPPVVEPPIEEPPAVRRYKVRIEATVEVEEANDE